MTYRRAKALDKLVTEVNLRFPGRSKVSDGWIGDPAHATRNSDHNPWVKDGAVGVVTAEDITEDDAPGVPEIADFIVATLVKRRDKRVKYLIHEGRIWRSYAKPGIPAWTSSPYTGTNAHMHHVHISVLPDKALYDSTAGWGIYPPPVAKRPTLKFGSHGPDVLRLTVALNRHGYKTSDRDVFGNPTFRAMKQMQTSKHLPVDGICTADDWKALGL